MKTSDGILMIEPSGKASTTPLIDNLTRKMTAAWRLSLASTYSYRGVHTCTCGVWSDNKDHWVGDGLLTTSLCVHYLSFHRNEIPEEELNKVRALTHGEEEPNEKELAKPKR